MNNPSLFSVSFVLLVVLVLLTLFSICYLFITSKSRERLALIEKGMDPNLANNDFWTQIGVIGGGASLGLIAGGELPGDYGPLLGILFAGAAVVIYNVLKQKSRRNKFK